MSRRYNYLREFIFGVEDSLVSTVGLLSGVAAAQLSAGAIILTGSVLVIVESFSMGVGSVLSDHSVREYEDGGAVALSRSTRGGIVMSLSYFLSGAIPLIPYLLFNQVATALIVSIIVSLATLFLLGIFVGKISHTNKLKEGIEMVLLGGLAIALGVFVGRLVGV